MIKQSQSVFDHFFNLYPDISNQTQKKTDLVDYSAANTLFSIWRTSDNKVGNKVYKRPPTISLSEVEKMSKAGLIRSIGENIEITPKGEKVIKIMVLGDERSSFEDDGVAIDYNEAVNNTEAVKVAKKTKVASWWSRFENNNS
tara:strand:- start:14668 stop:15096 length:429 start_codon:yes stop_codon:yes gene_type:complete